MKKTFKTFLILVILLLGGGMTSINATTLTVGDIVIVAINGDADATYSYGRGFSFMPLVNLDAGTVINFTDYGWSDVNTAFISNTSIADAFIHYTAPAGGITAGTIIRCDSYINNNFTFDYTFSGTGTNKYLNLAGLTQGDELLIFTGTRTSPTFIFAASIVNTTLVASGWATSVGANGTDNSGAGSALPPGLTDDVTALSFNKDAASNDNAAYNGNTTSATKAGWLTLLDNYSNWNFSDLPPIPIPPAGPYTVTGTATAPSVTTQAASSIASTTATGNGIITVLGVPNPTAYGVCWNTTGTPTTSDSKADNGTASATGAFTASMTSLSANTAYFVRAYATNTAGTSYGTEVMFTTSAIAPTVTTQAVSSIASTTATGNGTITVLGVPNPTAYGVCWNTTGTPTTSDSKANNGATSTTGAFTASMTGLTANATYHVRAFATNTAGTSYGSEVTFTTSAIAPTVSTQAITNISSTTATANGTITVLGIPNPTAYGVCWNTNGTPTIFDYKANKGAVSVTGIFSANMTGLSGNRTYYVRAYATNTAGTSYGDVVSFTTSILTVTWNGTAWSPSAPTANDDAILDADYNAAGFNCNNLTINAGKQLTVSSDLFVSGNLTLKSDASGTATIVDDNKIAVLGTTTVEQYLTSGRNWYVSSPIGNATSAIIIDEVGSKLWKYNEATPAWDEIINNTTTLNEMVGYVVNKASNGIVSFTGDWYNNGDMTIDHLSRTVASGTKRGFNLIGNPYPSCVNWKSAVDGLFTSNLETSIWYRSKNGADYVFDTYNATSNTGTHNYGGTDVTGIIPPIQAVWVRVNADNVEGSVTFNNTMRSHPSLGNRLKDDANTNNMIRLQVANGKSSDEAIILFNSNASNTYDAWDSQKMFTESADVPQIYTTADAEKVVINGLESINTNNNIPLGFKTAKAGTFTISATEINGVDIVVLEDKLLNKTQDLTGSASYTFTSDNVDNSSRFAIRLKANSVTDVPEALKSTTTIVAQNQSIVVTTSESSGTINVYDILGRVVITKAIEGTKTVLYAPVGVYFVKAQTDTNIETKKLVIE